jgi:hypothetical protein
MQGKPASILKTLMKILKLEQLTKPGIEDFKKPDAFYRY